MNMWTGISVIAILFVIISFLMNKASQSCSIIMLYLLCYWGIVWVVYNRISPCVSRYFRLTRKNRQEFHLQKNIVLSLMLICRHKPQTALLKLCRDLSLNAVPAALSRIPAGSMLVIETHLFEKGMLRYTNVKFDYEKKKPKRCLSISAISARITMLIASIIRFILGKGWDRPRLHEWYRLTYVKPYEKEGPGVF